MNTKRMWMALCLASSLVCLIGMKAIADETCLPSADAQVSAGSSLVIESKTVYQGKSVTVGLAITNDVLLKNIEIPLIIRELDPGAFITTLSLQRTPGGRLALPMLGGFNVMSTYANEDGVTCKVDRPGGLKTISPVNGISPDGARFSLGKLFPIEPSLQPGTDPSTGSLQLLMTVNNTVGRFEVDTTCCDLGSHLVFVQDPTASILPQFTKGVITIAPCDCPSQGDVNGDGVIDVFDVIGIIGIAFSGDADPQDPECPRTRGDANSDGVTDVFDVIYLIATAFSGGAGPIDPCVP